MRAVGAGLVLAASAGLADVLVDTFVVGGDAGTATVLDL
jgi:hypothetical protein